eukprot:4449332-Pyramimonas_sp.AAC.1
MMLAEAQTTTKVFTVHVGSKLVDMLTPDESLEKQTTNFPGATCCRFWALHYGPAQREAAGDHGHSDN